jgi:hypothetical protein
MTAATLPGPLPQEKLDTSTAAGVKEVLQGIEVVQGAYQGAQIAYDSYQTSRFFTVGAARF